MIIPDDKSGSAPPDEPDWKRQATAAGNNGSFTGDTLPPSRTPGFDLIRAATEDEANHTAPALRALALHHDNFHKWLISQDQDLRSYYDWMNSSYGSSQAMDAAMQKYKDNIGGVRGMLDKYQQNDYPGRLNSLAQRVEATRDMVKNLENWRSLKLGQPIDPGEQKAFDWETDTQLVDQARKGTDGTDGTDAMMSAYHDAIQTHNDLGEFGQQFKPLADPGQPSPGTPTPASRDPRTVAPTGPRVAGPGPGPGSGVGPGPGATGMSDPAISTPGGGAGKNDAAAGGGPNATPTPSLAGGPTATSPTGADTAVPNAQDALAAGPGPGGTSSGTNNPATPVITTPGGGNPAAGLTGLNSGLDGTSGLNGTGSTGLNGTGNTSQPATRAVYDPKTGKIINAATGEPLSQGISRSKLPSNMGSFGTVRPTRFTSDATPTQTLRAPTVTTPEDLANRTAGVNSGVPNESASPSGPGSGTTAGAAQSGATESQNRGGVPYMPPPPLGGMGGGQKQGSQIKPGNAEGAGGPEFGATAPVKNPEHIGVPTTLRGRGDGDPRARNGARRKKKTRPAVSSGMDDHAEILDEHLWRVEPPAMSDQ